MATFVNELMSEPNPAAQLPAFRAWARSYEAPIYRLALNLTGNSQDAESVLVETFVKAAQQFPAQPEGGRDYGWLVGLALRESLCAVRASNGDFRGWLHDQSVPLDERDREPAAWAEHPEKSFPAAQWRRILLEALSTLTPVDRAVFVLCDMEKFAAADVARLLCIETHEVTLRLARARVLLRDRLDPVCRVGGRRALPARAVAVRPVLPRTSRPGMRRAVFA